MKGVKYLFDDKGTPQVVMIDLKKNRKLWEDFQDLLVVQERNKETRISWEKVKSKLRKNGKAK